MPPHHHKPHQGPNYGDMWWKDMPEKAHRAAKVLGYTAESWDADAHVPYDDKKFVDCTYAEKNAAMYLKLSPIHKKLDPLWWNDVDEETKKHAAVLGWDQHKWDDDWSIESLPCEHWWWRDMTPEQQTAGRHFGYGKGTWDYVEDAEEDFDPSGVAAPFANMNVTPAAAAGGGAASAVPQKKMQTSAAAGAGGSAASGGGAKPFMVSPAYGGDGGVEFDHMNQRQVQEMFVYSDRHVIHGIKVVYQGHTKLAGKAEGSETHFVLTAGEYIVGAKIRAGKLLQALSFSTNKGNTLGPVGGKGWLIGGKDKQGQDFESNPPPGGYQLCGIKGKSSDDAIDSIMFRWGPVN